MEDSIPATLEGQILLIADKLDTLIECFQIGLAPTGSKDPFALRRAAQGIVKILFEARLSIDILHFVKVPALTAFLLERIFHYLQEVRGYPYDEVRAIAEVPVKSFPDLLERIEALHTVRPTEDFEAVAASFKRIKNILRQAGFSGAQVDPARLTAGPERELYEAFEGARANDGGYVEQLRRMASLRPQIDLFFDKILVNDPNEAIRKNRLALLDGLLSEFNTIADFSEIVTRGEAA